MKIMSFRDNSANLMNPPPSNQSTTRSVRLTRNLIIAQSQQSGIIKKSASHLTKINIAPSQTANFVSICQYGMTLRSMEHPFVLFAVII